MTTLYIAGPMTGLPGFNLPAFGDEQFDAIVTDPPYGLAEHKPDALIAAVTAWAGGDRERVPTGRGFMGREWDAFVPPPAVWDECLRVLKPGGHLVAFAGSRTYDLMGLSIRMAGFEIRDGLQWLYGSGFPKSLDVSKAIDKARDDKSDVRVVCRWLRARIDEHPTETTKSVAAAFGVHSRMVDHWAARDTDSQPSMPTIEQWERLRVLLGFGGDVDDEVWRLNGRKGTWGNERPDRVIGDLIVRTVYNSTGPVVATGTPVLDEAARWQGWGTALKPAHEPIVLARKPLGGTVAATVLAHGTGALNIDACRVPGDEDGSRNRPPSVLGSASTYAQDEWTRTAVVHRQDTTGKGRWPANVILDEHAAAELDAQTGTLTSGKLEAHHARRPKDAGILGAYGSADGERGYGDSGGASRFFYCAKAPTRERPKVDGVAHPTVKPLALMRWLVRLVCPPGGVVLDPFAGSGTTLEAARAEGVWSFGIERDPSYLPLIDQRLGLTLPDQAVAVPCSPTGA